jgi:predicted N-formylglutamate amidohydrolase
MRRRVTVTVEASTAEAAEAAVAAGHAPSVSAWVASAMTEHAHRESLAEVLAKIRSELGPASDEETAWARSVLGDPDDLRRLDPGREVVGC